jgi:phosphoribosyl 1,2-cyclic phosphodiesterase
MHIKFWGVHGSLPRPGKTTLKYGGNTACVEVWAGGTLLVFDAGTGIRDLGDDLCRRSKDASGIQADIRGHIFFSHLHWDHVQGFPFFAPAYMAGNEFHLYAGRGLNETIYKLMRDQMAEPNFPVCLTKLSASIFYHDLDGGQRLQVDGTDILTHRMNHPGGSFGYRVFAEGRSMVYASDTEYVGESADRMVEFAREADVLIHDSMFTPEQYRGLVDDCPRESWGHSTWEGAVELAKSADVGRLILFHHGNDDDVVEDMERKARERFPNTEAAYEGLTLDV